LEDLKAEELAPVKSIFLAVGGDDRADFLNDFVIIKDQLLEKRTPNLQLETIIIQDEGHITVIPATIVKGLKFLYGTK